MNLFCSKYVRGSIAMIYETRSDREIDAIIARVSTLPMSHNGLIIDDAFFTRDSNGVRHAVVWSVSKDLSVISVTCQGRSNVPRDDTEEEPEGEDDPLLERKLRLVRGLTTYAASEEKSLDMTTREMLLEAALFVLRSSRSDQPQ